jgi:anionic cell wall polymer biosynthesis LytR-Cps2A-Psr (LCP) family protein
MVDAIGGIDICNAQSFYDSKINFQLDQGMHHLDGNQALSYVRTRRATADGDFGRMRRQQEFIRAVMSRVGKPSVLGNPVRVNSLATSFARNVAVDQLFQVSDLVRLAVSIRRVGPDQLLTYSVPGHIGRIGGQSVVIMEQDKSAPLFQALRDVADPSQVIPPTTGRQQAAPAALGASGVYAQAPPGQPCAPPAA